MLNFSLPLIGEGSGKPKKVLLILDLMLPHFFISIAKIITIISSVAPNLDRW